MAQEVKHITVNPGEMAGDGALTFVMRAPAAYGGVTIIGAQLVVGLAGTLNLVLQNYGTSGTVAGGTVGGMSGGTATIWVADVPQALTLTAANVFIDEGEYLVAKKVEAGATDDLTNEASLLVEYVDGIVAVG